jgi:FkbM family methyltransferase
MKYYSQAGQDEWVVKFFNEKKNGFFLDIGAHNGIDINNTYYLEKNLDWSGICIEADPVIFEDLKNNRNSICVNCAASDSVGYIKFSQDGFSGKINELTGTVDVKSNTIANILRDNNAPKIIDYISLDVEGYESKVLSKFPFDEYEFIIMTVEHNLYIGNTKNKEEIKEILLKNGYVIAVENVQHENFEFEDWYVNKKYYTEY